MTKFSKHLYANRSRGTSAKCIYLAAHFRCSFIFATPKEKAGWLKAHKEALECAKSERMFRNRIGQYLPG